MPEAPVFIPVDDQVTLEGGFSRAQPAWGSALVLHPHPLYGGSMDNNVVLALVNIALAGGLCALRVNFRGVGRSTGRHENGLGEVADVAAASGWLAGQAPGPLLLLGYSFGSLVGARAAADLTGLAGGVWVSPPLALGELPPWPEGAGPLLIVIGDHDEFTDIGRLQQYAAIGGAPVSLKLHHGADHFWWGGESALNEYVSPFIREISTTFQPCPSRHI